VKHSAAAFCALFLIVCLVSSAGAQNPSHLAWRIHETEHYIVYYPVGQEFTAFRVAEVAEKMHGPLAKMYGEVDSKIHIVIRDDEDYANGGAYFDQNKIEVYASGLDYEFRSYSNWLWNVVTHELTHVYSMRTSFKASRRTPMLYYQHIDYQEEKREDVLVGYPNVLASYAVPMFNVPSWLAEGVAQYQTRTAHFDSLDAHRDMILRQAALGDKLLDINQMAIFAWDGRGNEMVYNHGYSLVGYIARKYGDAKVTEIMGELSKVTAITFDTVCRRVLNTSAEKLHREWAESLKEQYTALRDSLGPLVEGRLFRKGGFLNGFPVWSPDGTRLAYISNKGQDYSIRACFVADLEPGGWKWKKKDKDEADAARELEKRIAKLKKPEEIESARAEAAGMFDIALGGGIQSGPVWLDRWNILYNKRMPSDRHGSHWWDMYRYVINTRDPRRGTEKRITHDLRGTYPDLSPDGRWLVFVQNGAGLNNLVLMDRNDNSRKNLTSYRDGTQMYRPRWSPDGSRVAFTVHRGNTVDIAVIDRDGGNFACVASSPGQDRDPAWTSDGKSIVFSSDVTGIPNLYKVSLDDGTVRRLTNVIGGAFAPDVSPADTTIAFSSYGPDGYEIRLLPMSDGQSVEAGIFHRPSKDIANTGFAAFDTNDSKPYRMKTLDVQFMPRIINDRGRLKLGAYVLKSEIIDQGAFMFGGDIAPSNRDTDLFASFEYKRFIPTVFVEMYRQTRSVGTDENYMEEYGTIIKKRTFDLNEIDFGLRYTYRDRHRFEGRLIYSQYNAKLEYTHFLTGSQVYKPYYTYSRGFDLSLTYNRDSFTRARDEVINPRGGRKIQARYDRYVNFFLDDFEYVGFLREKYKKYPYNALFVNWVERIPVPVTEKHTLLLRGQVNLIDRHIDSFYENQLGGPNQMRGYTFYSLSGRKNAMGQVLYRFPLLYDMKKKFFLWYLNHVYMGVFADIGRAWNKQSLNWSSKGFKRDAGVELRFDALSFYNFPTMVEFSAAYGPDDTWIQKFDSETSVFKMVKDDQDPWKFYFNVLFGFTQ
jgi:Tol biopolymer transport system component